MVLWLETIVENIGIARSRHDDQYDISMCFTIYLENRKLENICCMSFDFNMLHLVFFIYFCSERHFLVYYYVYLVL